MTLFLLSVIIALSVSGLCSLLEATLLSLPSSQVAALSARHPAAEAIWRRFRGNIERPIAVILIVNTAAYTIGATVAGAQFEVLFGNTWLLAFSLFFTYLMLQFTEVLPKTLGVRYNKSLSIVVARPLDLLVRTLSPVLWFIRLVNRPFEDGTPEKPTLEEIMALATEARHAKSIDARQARMILAVSRLRDLCARQIMTPRTRVASLRVDQPIEQILDIVKNSPYTRLPLCEKDIDHIVGIVHVRDLFAQLDLVPGRLDIEHVILSQGRKLPESGVLPGSGLHVIGSGSIDLRKIRRDVLYFPDHVSPQRMLRQFQESRVHLGVIVDEYGSTLGIVTLEDVLEEIVGEIEDEFDRPGIPMVVREEHGIRVRGELPIHELREYVELDDEEVEGVDTAGGYVAKAFGRLPSPGDTIESGRYVIRILSADGRKVREVLLQERPSDDTNRGGTE